MSIIQVVLFFASMTSSLILQRWHSDRLSVTLFHFFIASWHYRLRQNTIQCFIFFHIFLAQQRIAQFTFTSTGVILRRLQRCWLSNSSQWPNVQKTRPDSPLLRGDCVGKACYTRQQMVRTISTSAVLQEGLFYRMARAVQEGPVAVQKAVKLGNSDDHYL